MLARMRPDVSRPPAILGRLATSACVMALATSACSTLPTGEITAPQGREFIAMVPDSVDDVGLGASIGVDDDGLPVISYLGFPGTVEAGGIPVTRPIGAPYLKTEDGKDAGAVLLASLSSEQIWSRGAVAQPRETPSGVTVPFGPAAEPSLESLTPHNAHGTDVALDGADIHVVWAADTGVWYGLGPNFEIGTIEETREAGTPSIALDASGAPLVAYTLAGVTPEVRFAERSGETWGIGTVTTLSACGSACPPPTQVGLVGGKPLVVVADPQSGDVIAARRAGTGWQTEVVAKGTGGGASLATSGDTAVIAYYTDSGVSIATGGFGRWSVQEVGSVAPAETPSPSASASASPAPPKRTPPEPTTGVAVDGQGTIWVTWQDGEGIHLASSEDGGDFEEAELSDTSSGVTPTVAVTEDGSSVYLAWYDLQEQDLRAGALAEVTGLLVAAPSPTAAATTGGAQGCGDDGKPILDIVAAGTSFNTLCLVALAGKPFSVSFDNQDPFPHNLSIYSDADYSTPVQQMPQTGAPVSEKITYHFDAIDQPGTYYFQCDFHPIPSMRGVFEVVKGAGK